MKKLVFAIMDLGVAFVFPVLIQCLDLMSDMLDSAITKLEDTTLRSAQRALKLYPPENAQNN